MPRFRKRPIIVEAVQWFPGVRIEGVVASPVLEPTPDNPGGEYGQIRTLEGGMTVRPGDWIVTGGVGERYPVKDEIFRATYEAVPVGVPVAPCPDEDARQWATGVGVWPLYVEGPYVFDACGQCIAHLGNAANAEPVARALAIAWNALVADRQKNEG